MASFLILPAMDLDTLLDSMLILIHITPDINAFPNISAAIHP